MSEKVRVSGDITRSEHSEEPTLPKVVQDLEKDAATKAAAFHPSIYVMCV
jgi:hypothetical protein